MQVSWEFLSPLVCYLQKDMEIIVIVRVNPMSLPTNHANNIKGEIQFLTSSKKVYIQMNTPELPPFSSTIVKFSFMTVIKATELKGGGKKL